jgi:hypothetical protein
MQTEEGNEITDKLDKVEHRLAAALGEVCEDTPVTGVRKPDTGELIRIDETLALASEAAKQAISLRRQLRTKKAKKSSAKERPERSSERSD